MHIWIAGDSWATPNYFNPMPGWRAKGHVSELLADDGHTIFNFGWNGESNLQSFYQSTTHHEDYIGRPDVVIWFHTSLVRDYVAWNHMMEPADCILHQIDNAAKVVYSEVEQILKNAGNPELIVIEGHGKIIQSEFNKHFDPSLYVKNWRGQICGVTDCHPHFVSESMNITGVTSLDEQELEQLVTDIERVQDSMHHDMFPDFSHPGDIPHQELYTKIQQVLRRINK